MTGSTAQARDARPQARPPFRTVVRAVLRAAVSAAALVALYYLLPLNTSSTPAAVTILVTGFAGFIALVAFQAHAVIRHPFPTLRAIEALATSIPLFLLLFAASYVVMATRSADDFGGHLTHTDGLYFAVTVFSTVGFGDITAKTAAARLVVTGQMVADLVILGTAIKIITSAVSRGQQHRQQEAGGAPPAEQIRG